jgi:hypothetical protein
MVDRACTAISSVGEEGEGRGMMLKVSCLPFDWVTRAA